MMTVGIIIIKSTKTKVVWCAPGGAFQSTRELLILSALKFSILYKNEIFHCVGKIFCVEFQRFPLKFHTKYLTHALKDDDFIQCFETPPRSQKYSMSIDLCIQFCCVLTCFSIIRLYP